MKKNLLLLIFGITLFTNTKAQSLSAGDIAFIGYNTDAGTGINDDFTFIILKDIPGSEVIYFTEEGWDNNSNIWAGTTEAHLTYTAPPGGLACGTIVHFNENVPDVFTVTGGGSASLSSGSNWSLSAGDQVLAYQAATPEPATTPTFIAGVHGDDGNGSPTSLDPVTKWNDPTTGPLGTAKSSLPAGLTNGVNCVSLFPSIGTETDNAKYTGTLTGNATTIRALINDYTNWSSDDATPYDISPSAYSPSITCTPPCTDPDIPTITYSPATICSGNSATLTISGNLNDATAWHIYTGSCGGSSLGTTAGSSFTVTPSMPSTTYYVRGEGGCVTPGSCGSVTVNVTAPDNASFSYGASAYCVNASDPTPTVTGLGGGTFSSSPTGLSLNSSTGMIDVSASTPNSYTITYTTSGSCPSSSNVSVTITALDDASFSYGASAYCMDASDPTPTVTGLGGGIFTSSPSGLSISSSTGMIDVSASTPNTYTVIYSTTGFCSNSSTVSVTINALDDASFSYGASAYCVNVSDPTPTISGLGGGTFSSTPSGLSLNSSSGTIDVSASTPNTYLITYITGGSCPNSTNVSVTINALDDPSFSYGASTYCMNDSDPTPTVTGLGGGIFTSSPSGLSISSSTGTIDVSASTPNTYTVIYSTTGFCSNSSTVSVTIDSVDVSTTLSALTITANETGASYKWLDCDNSMAPISGETSQSYTATTNGNYAVEVTKNGCVDTSGCVSIMTVGIDGNHTYSINLFPNPTSGQITINLPQLEDKVEITVLSLSGKIIESNQFIKTSKIVLNPNLADGAYVIAISNSKGQHITKKLFISATE